MTFFSQATSPHCFESVLQVCWLIGDRDHAGDLGQFSSLWVDFAEKALMRISQTVVKPPKPSLYRDGVSLRTCCGIYECGCSGSRLVLTGNFFAKMPKWEYFHELTERNAIVNI